MYQAIFIYSVPKTYAGDAVEVRSADSTAYGSGTIEANGSGIINIEVPEDLVAALYLVRTTDDFQLPGVTVFDWRDVPYLNSSFTADDRTDLQAAKAAAVAANTRLQGWSAPPSSITVTNPVFNSGKTLSLVQGDAYPSSLGRALVWSYNDPQLVPIREAGLTWWLVIGNVALFALPMVDTWDGDSVLLTLELTSDQTAVLNKQCRRFLIQALEEGATPTDNEQVSLVVGVVEVKETMGALTGTPVPS